MNLSSIVIRTKPEHLVNLLERLQKSSLCEYHLHDPQGRIIVTIEGKGVDEEVSKLKEIQQMEHVISAEMMFAYSEDELELLRDKVERNQGFPGWLNDENIRAEEIKYQGDLKKRL